MTPPIPEPSPPAAWVTRITRVERNVICVAGVPLQELIGRRGLPDVVGLLLGGALPAAERRASLTQVAWRAAGMPLPPAVALPGERVARRVARLLLSDDSEAPSPDPSPEERVLFRMGRVVRELARLLGRETALDAAAPDEPLSGLLARAWMAPSAATTARARMLEALAVATVDHGLTPPSVQAVRLAASVRAPLECALAAGLACITRVHGGAGWEAAELFREANHRARAAGAPPVRMLEEMESGRLRDGMRIPGLGHRVHDADPRVEALWRLAEETGTAGPCVESSHALSGVLQRLGGVSLPVNVDGVIGAVIADLGLPAALAEGVFLLGRLAGFAAHYFEEVSGFREMRWLSFSDVRAEPPRRAPTPDP